MENPVKTKISTTCLTPAGPLSSGEERRKKKCVLVWLDGWLASLRKFRISSLCGSARRWRESPTHVSRHPKGDKPVEMAYNTVLGLKRGKKKSLSTPFRRLRFTQCRWAHHFTKLHIIGFVYYSSLLTFHYVGDCIRRVIAGAIQSIGAIGAIGETRACERNNQNDRHAWPWLGGVKAECFGMFPAAGEMCTTSVRTSRCSVEGGGKKKRNKQNPTKKCPFRKKPNRSAVPTARCKYRNARNWRRRIY